MPSSVGCEKHATHLHSYLTPRWSFYEGRVVPVERVWGWAVWWCRDRWCRWFVVSLWGLAWCFSIFWAKKSPTIHVRLLCFIQLMLNIYQFPFIKFVCLDTVGLVLSSSIFEVLFLSNTKGTSVDLHSVFQKNISHFFVVHFSTAKLSPPFKDTSVTYLPTVQPFNVISSSAKVIRK